jgi:hypothetical protein
MRTTTLLLNIAAGLFIGICTSILMLVALCWFLEGKR